MDNFVLSGWVKAITEACDQKAVLRTATHIARFHRIQASSGYHAAAVCASRILSDTNLNPQIVSYPADRKTTYFTQKSFRQWECRKAWLQLTSPWQERVADYNLEEMSLIQRSAPLDCGDQDIDIIYVPDGTAPEDFCEDVQGKLIFVKNGFERWNEFVMERGAAGILTVNMPEVPPVRVRPWDDPQMRDSHANLSFHHFTGESEEKLRGFALSPRFGKMLEESCVELGREGKHPTARFCIDSTFEDGVIENVIAVIEGTTDEEVLLTAHLCHPRSSVNDNASGAACAIETMCTLQRLLDAGKLEKPRRTIRMILIPEFTGTYCWLAENQHRLNKVVAGFNMDMVGGHMDGTTGPLIIVDTPDAAHAFNGDLCDAILAYLQKECAFGGPGRYVPMTFALRVPFALGSDHYILSDPTIDIPTVALTQWPDKTYHTSVDQAAHLDADLMKKDVVWAGTYCLAYANLPFAVMQEVLPFTERRLFDRINSMRYDDTLSSEQRAFKSAYLAELTERTLKRFIDLLPDEDRTRGAALAKQETDYICSLLAQERGPEMKHEGPKPKRLFLAPLAMRCVRAELTDRQKKELNKLEQKYSDCSVYMDQILYEVDGTRTVEEIAKCVFCETGRDCRDYAQELVEFLCRLGLVSM